jgi:hypothetical protein
MTDTINDHVEGIVKTVDKRLTLIIDTLMGENPKQKQRGVPPLIDAARDYPLNAMQRNGLAELAEDWHKSL